MKPVVKIIAPVLVIALAIGGYILMAASKPPPEKTEDTQLLVSLFTDPVREDIVTPAVQTQGEVSAKTIINLEPRVTGPVVEVADRFAAGAAFEQGDLLLRLDDTDYRLALTRAQARVAEAELRLAQAEAAAQIRRQQYESSPRERRAGSPTPLQVNKPQIREAEAFLASAQADLAEANLNLDRTRIRAPFDGRVVRRDVGLGQFVRLGTVLGRVFATDVVEVELPLTDSQLQQLDLPMGFVADDASSGPMVTFSATIGGKQRQWQGHIARTMAGVNEQTRLVSAIAEVADPYATEPGQPPLAVGMFVDASIRGKTPQNAMVMPRAALRGDNEVYVVNSDSELEIRSVDVLSTTADHAMVLSGVRPGEEVVTSTVANPVAGMQVKAISSRQAPSEEDALESSQSVDGAATTAAVNDAGKKDSNSDNSEDQPAAGTKS